MKLFSNKSLVIAVILCLAVACTKSSEDDRGNGGSGGSGGAGGSGGTNNCAGSAKSFSNDVNPIIQTFCGGCHGNGSNAGPGPLVNYTQIFNARNLIRSSVSSGRMPQNGSLTAAQKNAILCWIDNGAPEN